MLACAAGDNEAVRGGNGSSAWKSHVWRVAYLNKIEKNWNTGDTEA